MIPQETEMSCGWPLGLEIINLRLGQSPPIAEPMRLTSYSSASSSNSETVSTSSFFDDRSVTLGRLIGIRSEKVDRESLYFSNMIDRREEHHGHGQHRSSCRGNLLLSKRSAETRSSVMSSATRQHLIGPPFLTSWSCCFK